MCGGGEGGGGYLNKEHRKKDVYIKIESYIRSYLLFAVTFYLFLELYKKVTSLKGRNKKVLLALGGWNDSAGSKYSKLVNSAENRRKFVDHAVKFLKKHNFDGLDLDWEYPKCWQVDCSKGELNNKFQEYYVYQGKQTRSTRSIYN